MRDLLLLVGRVARFRAGLPFVPDLAVRAVAVGITDPKGFAAHPFPAKGDA